MPEYILDESNARDDWHELDAFTKGFIECLFFTNQCPNWTSDSDFTIENWFTDEVQSRVSEGQSDGVIPSDCGVGHIHPDSLARVKAYCERWQLEHAAILERAYNAHWEAVALRHGWSRVAHSGMFSAPVGHDPRLVDYESWQELCECEGLEPDEPYDASQAGRDLFYEREGHGVGFTDRKALPPELAQELSQLIGYHEAQIWFGDHVENGNAPWVYIEL